MCGPDLRAKGTNLRAKFWLGLNSIFFGPDLRAKFWLGLASGLASDVASGLASGFSWILAFGFRAPFGFTSLLNRLLTWLLNLGVQKLSLLNISSSSVNNSLT